MPTLRQEKLADAIVENARTGKYKTKGEMLRAVGYSRSTSVDKPKEVFELPGVRQALAARGFTVENAKRVVEQIMNNEDEKGDTRLRASDMVFKVHGTYAPEKKLNLAVTARLEELDKLGNEDILSLLSGDTEEGGTVDKLEGGE